MANQTKIASQLPYTSQETANQATVDKFKHTQPTQPVGTSTYFNSPQFSQGGTMGMASLSQVLDLMKPTLTMNNNLVKQKNLVYKQLYDAPLSDEEKKALTPGLKLAIESGNRNLIDQQVAGINDQIKGLGQTVDTSISDFLNFFAKAQEAQQNIINKAFEMRANGIDDNTVSQYFSAMGIDPSTILNSSVSIPQDTLAYRNNNPGNLKFAGQQGATMGEGGFAKFDSPQAGYQALVNQIQLDSSRGKTVEDFISKYAPKTENNTEGYIQSFESKFGVSRGTPLSNVNIGKMAQFMAFQESRTTLSYAGTGSADSSINAMASQVKSGVMKISEVPANLRGKVSSAMETLPMTDEEKKQQEIVDNQITVMNNSLQKSLELADASGMAKWKRDAMGYLYGANDYTELDANTKTLKTNLLTLFTSPDVKKFFGPQMSNSDVSLMTSIASTLDPESLSPDSMRTQLNEVKKVLKKTGRYIEPGQGGGQSEQSDPLGIL